MKNLKKILLFFGAIVTVLLMVSSATGGIIIKTKQTDKTVNKSEKTASNMIKYDLFGKSRISVLCGLNTPTGAMPNPFQIVKCKDLNTGITRYGLTGLLGLHTFKLLPKNHDYNISCLGFPDAYRVVENLQYPIQIQIIL